jgi:3-oxoacyl-[acyl-carrier protein] reductase
MKDQVTVITGGAQGIGRAIAEFIATKGGRVAILDIIDGMETAKTIIDRGGSAEAFIVDVADFKATGDVINMVVERMGRLDNLVNNAGIAIDRLLLRMKEEDWDKVMAVNLKGAFNAQGQPTDIC